ncbi:multidrug effflux MFS transporter [Vibrio cyclitrophicus]|uniref:multidrug effflux MFS transporter n=1 Tax=Vibrio cyclitrophicus TaxID=47951 RepID=UPI0002F2B9A2|nr:multidrug effflux MFS transporter [Vibrio cyclitrophicus]OED95200.1 Bcr/CflA subfamily drug resistance transporter [Vibrio cyclitrophicus ZF28]PMG86879.1 Bcr/CflA subfamily drug resistance transporter [Vibrio cyclitrophicus]
MKEKLSYSFWLFPIVAVSSLGLDIFIPALPAINDAFGASQQSTQLLISVYVFALSIGQLIFGPYIDKHGCQKAFNIGITLCAAASVAIVFSESLSLLVLMRFVQGLGAGAVAVSVFSSVPKIFKKEISGKVFGLFSSVLSVVPVLAPLLGGLLTAVFNWEACFSFLAIYMIFCILVNRYKPLPSKVDVNQDTSDAGRNLYAKLLTTRSFIIGCMACSLGFSTQLVFFSSSPLVIIEQFGIGTEYFGLLFAINAFSITAGSLLAVKLIGRCSEESIIKAGSVILLVSGFGFSAYHFMTDVNVWHFMAPSCLGSFGFALLMSAGTTLALSEFSQQSGRASSLNGSAQLIVASLFSWLVINFWDSEWKTITIFYVFGGLMIFGSTFLRKPMNRVKATCIQPSK